ncbi:MAG: hypothetical protein OXC41_01860 [Gammaproteobacteria bacterium]|nr:hypothetical protein [Gammaproteobacteria bacterium]
MGKFSDIDIQRQQEARAILFKHNEEKSFYWAETPDGQWSIHKELGKGGHVCFSLTWIPKTHRGSYDSIVGNAGYWNTAEEAIKQAQLNPTSAAEGVQQNQVTDFHVLRVADTLTITASSKNGRDWIDLYRDMYQFAGCTVDGYKITYKGDSQTALNKFVYELCDHNMAASFSF